LPDPVTLITIFGHVVIFAPLALFALLGASSLLGLPLGERATGRWVQAAVGSRSRSGTGS
jgi:hypothetical protein